MTNALMSKSGDYVPFPSQEVIAECCRQIEKWGIQMHEDPYWAMILGEEVGEVSKAILQQKADEIRTELVQVAAVAMSWIRCIDARKLNG